MPRFQILLSLRPREVRLTSESPAKRDLAIAIASNDDRAKYLIDELSRQSNLIAQVEFDQIGRATRYAAAALSFRPSRAEWWVNYQMHPLIERQRRRVLHRELRPFRQRLDGLVMWGSWFHPRMRTFDGRTPYTHYIDQSLALDPVLGEPREAYIDRRAAHRRQGETYRDAAAILCMSRWAREQTLLAHPTLPSEKVQVAGWGPCGVDLSATPQSWDEREPLVLHVSNDFHRKGLDFLVETAAIVRQSVPLARFVVVGADYGGMRNPPTGEGVTFTGRISDRAVLTDYFKRASVFFLPHRFDRSPHVLVEAMSAGIPLVTSAQGGALELTDGTGIGYALPIGDVAGYARTIVELLTNPDRARDTGQRGRQLMLRSYSWRSVAGRILDVIAAQPG